jgi:hypothetical protein
MRALKFVFSFYFFVLAALSLTVPLVDISADGSGLQVSDASFGRPATIARDVVLVLLAVVFGMGGVMAWRGRKSKTERSLWPIAASLLSLLTSVGMPLLEYRVLRRATFLEETSVFGILTIVGAIALVVFIRQRRVALR